MRSILHLIGRIVYWVSWPFFWVYFKVGPGRTRIVLINSQGEILAVRNWISDGCWSLPGGGVHTHEALPLAALRELREETGLRYEETQLAFKGTTKINKHGLEFVIHVFAASFVEGALTIQAHEIAAWAWVRPTELNTRNAGPDVLVALRMVQLT